MQTFAAILPGARVRTADGFIGTVERLDRRGDQHDIERTNEPESQSQSECMIVRSDDGGWHYRLPLSLVQNVTQAAFNPIVEVALTPTELLQYIEEPEARQEQAHIGAASTNGTNGTKGSDEVRVPVAAEELIAHKREVRRGMVRLHKGVETSEQRFLVPVYQEEAIIEHIAPERYDPNTPQHPDEIVIPIVEERLVVQKQVVVKEYLRIRKERVTKRYEVRGKVRRETVKITEERAPEVQGDTAPLHHELQAFRADDRPQHA